MDVFDPSSGEPTCENAEGVEGTSTKNVIGPGEIAGIAVGALLVLLCLVCEFQVLPYHVVPMLLTAGAHTFQRVICACWFRKS